MDDIPIELLAEVMDEIEEELGKPDEYSVSIEELLERLIEKGYRPEGPTLH